MIIKGSTLRWKNYIGRVVFLFNDGYIINFKRGDQHLERFVPIEEIEYEQISFLN